MDPSRESLLKSGSKYRKSDEIEKSRDSYDDSDSDLGSVLDATEFLTPFSDPLDPAASDPTDSEPKPAFLKQRSPRWSLRRPRSRRSRCCIALLVVVGFIWLIVAAGGAFVYKKFKDEPPYGQSPPWYPSPKGGTTDGWVGSYKKAREMVERMTLAEKVNVTTGTGWMMGLAVGTTGPALKAGFPQLQLQDGPLGLRFADNATAWPAGITVGATWNRELMYARGKAHGNEARNKGLNAILGPCIGSFGRIPAGGRNWEGFGPDPYLQGVAAAQTISGIQSEGVMATIKHFVANEQEHFRQAWEWGLPNAISSNIDDRTLHELYAWPFGDSVKAGVASVMCSYNMVNNSYACGNSKLLNGILKDEMGFQGFVMSDWRAQRSGVASALAGLDMTMPGDGLRRQDGKSLWGPQLTRAILNGSVPVPRLNDMVTRIVAAWYQLGQDDEEKWPREPPNFSSWTNERMGVMAPGSNTPQEVVEVNRYVDVRANHSVIAHQVAAEGTILLKNDDAVLPLSRGAKSTPDTGNKAETRQQQKVHISIIGEDAGPGEGPNFCKDRGCNQGTLGSGWGSGAVEFPYLVSPVDALQREFDASTVELHKHLSNNAPAAKDIGQDDLCIVFANADAGEGFLWADGVKGDRNDLYLQKGGDKLIASVAERCGGDVVVVIHSVGPVLLERWIDLPKVKAVVLANLPGQESGNALAAVLFGDTNPSGKLPYTIGKTLEDYGPGAKVLYIPNGVVPQQDFAEGLYVDYRHFDKKGIHPRFEFGHGLSYTSFNVSNARATAHKDKTPLPSARPPPAAEPPSYDDAIPDEREAIFPAEIRRLENYIYPYLDSVDDIVAHPYPYPDGYHTAQPPSGAGGDEGGNPDLWETYVTVSADVKNVGERAGKVVAQLYVGYPEGAADAGEKGEKRKKDVDFPVRVLRGFEKVYLEPGETKTVEFGLTRRDLSYWDVEAQNWRIVTEGKYAFAVGQSSRDLTAFAEW